MAYLKTFNLDDYEHIHNLVINYKLTKNPEYSGEILECFSLFLNKYVLLIKAGIYSLNNYSTRSFIKLFASNQIGKSISSYNFKCSAKDSSDIIVDNIVSYFKSTELLDLKQDLKTILLEMCLKYNDDKPTFHRYVKKNFHFYAYRYFEKLTRDPLGRGYICSPITSGSNMQDESDESINLIEDESATLDMLKLLEEIEIFYRIKSSDKMFICKKNTSIYDMDFLDVNWINGVTCSQKFSHLNPFEREILISWYILNNKDSVIAKKFGLCRATINKKRLLIKEKLKLRLIELEGK